MTVEELIQRLMPLDQAGREALLQELMAEGVEVTGDWEQVYSWAIDNAPNELLELQLLEPQGGTQQRMEQGRQAQQDQEILSQFTDPDSPGGSSITPQESQAAGEAGASESSRPTFTEPRWVQEIMALKGFDQGVLSEDQRMRVLKEVNLQYGTTFRSFEDLVAAGFMDQQTAANRAILESALDDTDMVSAFTYQLPSGDMFTVRQADMEYVQSRFGIDRNEMKSFVNMADRLGIKDPRGSVAWQPFLATLQATGLLDQLRPGADRTVGRPGRRAGVDVIPGQAPNPARAMFERSGLYQNVSPNIVRGEGLQPDRTVFSAAEVGELINEGLQRFNHDPAMAYLYVVDPALTVRIHATVQAGRRISGRDLQLVSQYAKDGGLVEGEWWQGSGSVILTNYLNWQEAELADREGGGGSDRDGGGGVIRQRPDPVAVDESLRTLYQSMFLEEPDDATLAKFRSQVNAAIDGAGEGESVDVSARMRQFARQDPRYAELYGRKPEGMSEEEYQAQFRSAQQSMLGAEGAGNEAVLAGLRSGKYQTAVGAAAGTAEAWDNSTFLGRLARAGQSIAEYT